eukprot:NODE_5_length_72347_cov_1.339331.p33 type:complete len:253 gc:universal NODE_5_length_72347_cov_1.339331:6084-5326(-)
MILNKTVLITGASAGIGKSCAFKFAKHNPKELILLSRRMSKLESIKDEINKQHPAIDVKCFSCDIQNKASITEVLRDVDADIVVNNAGLVIGVEHLKDVNADDMDTMINTNIKGLAWVTQEVLKKMQKKPYGHIINVGSIAGVEAYPGGSIYCATKHAVHAITKSLRFELMSTPIKVTEILPGLVETEFSEIRFRSDKEKAKQVYKGLQPLVGDDVADSICYCANTPPHVQIAELVIFPTAQASASVTHRTQ